MAEPDVALTHAEHVCLALIAEGATHGWAVGAELAPDGPVGRVWTLSRALTYRAIDTLADRHLIDREVAAGGSGGRRRTRLTVTDSGRDVVERWLDAPVEHPRDVRTELIVKLLLRERAGLPMEPLLRTQERAFASVLDSLTTAADDDVVDLWRREQARAIRRFLRSALDPSRAGTADQPAPRPELALSARNQLAATVGAVNHGDVMSTVHVALPDGQQLTAAITKDAAVDLDVAPGDGILAIVKSTEVMLAKPG